jgi:hypothetical protein
MRRNRIAVLLAFVVLSAPCSDALGIAAAGDVAIEGGRGVE